MRSGATLPHGATKVGEGGEINGPCSPLHTPAWSPRHARRRQETHGFDRKSASLGAEVAFAFATEGGSDRAVRWSTGPASFSPSSCGAAEAVAADASVQTLMVLLACASEDAESASSPCLGRLSADDSATCVDQRCSSKTHIACFQLRGGMHSKASDWPPHNQLQRRFRTSAEASWDGFRFNSDETSTARVAVDSSAVLLMILVELAMQSRRRRQEARASSSETIHGSTAGLRTTSEGRLVRRHVACGPSGKVESIGRGMRFAPDLAMLLFGLLAPPRIL